MKRLLLVMLIVMIIMSVFAQLSQNQSYASDLALEQNNSEIIDQDYSLDQVYPSTPQNLIADGVTRLLAALLTSIIALACFYIQKYLKIYINEKNVIGLITEKCVELKKSPISNDDKKELVIKHIEKNKQVSKWAKILYGSLGRAVDVIFQTIVKKKLSI